MNNESSSTGQAPTFELPAPVTENGKLSAASGEISPVSSEKNAKSLELPTSGQPAQASSASLNPPLNDQTVAVGATSAAPGANLATKTSATTPLSAADADLIEDEWVRRAKEIVGKTSNDPYLQNKELNKMKADYIKKRYNKDIKFSEE